MHDAMTTVSTLSGGSVCCTQNGILSQQATASETGGGREAQASNRKVRSLDNQRKHIASVGSPLGTAMICWHCKGHVTQDYHTHSDHVINNHKLFIITCTYITSRHYKVVVHNVNVETLL